MKTREEFGIRIQSKNNFEYIPSLFNHLKNLVNRNFVSMKAFNNSNDVIIYRTESWYYKINIEKDVLYTIDLPGQNYYIQIWGKPENIIKDILSTIEIKK